MLRDPGKKKERGYVEPGSFVRQDGSEKLVGRDWTLRKIELGERCSWRCEWTPIDATGNEVDALRCRADYEDAHHHPIPRWKKRDDRLDNLVGVCRHHHNWLDGRKIGGRKSGLTGVK